MSCTTEIRREVEERRICGVPTKQTKKYMNKTGGFYLG